MKMTVRIEGTDAIARKLRAMGAALSRQVLEPVMTDALQPMAADMRSFAAKASGEMAESVTVGTELSPHQAAVHEPIAPVEVFAGPGPLPQAIAEEFGNYHQEPRPFIRPAFDGRVDAALKTVGKAGVAAILDAAKKG